MRIFPVCLAMLLLVAVPVIATEYSVVNSKHNLSISGPGELKSTVETRVCVFCHTPHHASQDPLLDHKPLWSRASSTQTYDPYFSATMDANPLPGQPTGSSRLCLSCHDGTVALGMLYGGYMLPGISATIDSTRASYIGTDLRNDHPVSFPYDSVLHSKDLELKDPASLLSTTVRLEPHTNFVQCTSCHNPHRDPDPPRSKFLVMPNYKNGTQLCLTCHEKTGWSVNIHATDTTIKDDGCQNCHDPHSAGSVNFPPLLSHRYDYSAYPQPYESALYDLCLRCHQESSLLDPVHPELTNFPKHYWHVVVQGVPCLACHPSHGVSAEGPNHEHLMEFSPIFVITGTYDSAAKSCDVVCHTKSHLSNPKYY